jgi:hypothetical protein
MPRRKIGVQSALPAVKRRLADALAAELRHEARPFGQPMVYEQEYPAGKVRVVVVWDEWADDPLEDRSAVILKAYEIVDGAAARDKIALASGLTVPEATAAGMLPYQIIAAIRRTDPVTPDQARQAFLELGASKLGNERDLQLRFATEEEAEACRRHLVERFPGSDDVWLVRRDIAMQDFGNGED